MQLSFLKVRIIGGLAALALAVSTLLTGCGAVRFAYGQGPELAYWWLDAYADFDDGEQTAQVRGALNEWFAWHRKTQLQDYAQFLAAAQSHAKANVTGASLCRLYSEAFDRIDPMLERAFAPGAAIVQTLTPAQIDHLERKYAKVDKEFRGKFLQRDPAERQEASVERAVKRAETMYGSLTSAQTEALAKGIAASPFDPQRWLDERMQRQRDTVHTLRRLVTQRATAEQTQAELRRLVRNAIRSPRESYVAYQQNLLQYNCALAAQLHNSTTLEQRQSAVKKLKGWEDDARALASGK